MSLRNNTPRLHDNLHHQTKTSHH